MKVIALLMFKNEERYLPTFLSCVKQLADEIICVDDNSTDSSVKIMLEAGAVVIKNEFGLKSGPAEFPMRQTLLNEARKRGGTHFICLDADESFSGDSINYIKSAMLSMNPGEKLSLRWVALWQGVYNYRDDQSVFGNLYKDFIFCDDGVSGYNEVFLHVGRTPSAYDERKLIKIDDNKAVVMHFQFVDWNFFQIKQVWLRCFEYMHKPRNVDVINNAYAITLHDSNAILKPVPTGWFDNLFISASYIEDPTVNWRRLQILNWFDEYGLIYFEPLQIWHIEEFHQMFIEQLHREPIIVIKPPLWLKVARIIKRHCKKIWKK